MSFMYTLYVMFFFKQKTAYEMRISDWSSDVCSSDLWLRRMALGNPRDLSVIRVTGDSMFPTLSDGDEILVDASDAAGRLRDGIYVLRVDGAIMVKRLAVNPAGHDFTVTSDNPAYPPWTGLDLNAVTVIGRVVWMGRRIS